MTRPIPCEARPSTAFVHRDGPCRCFVGGPAPEFGPDETDCRVCGRLALDHTPGRWSVYGTCPTAPEVVTTAAELDALPVGSVVRVEGSTSVGVWLKVADPHERWMGVEVDREDGWPAVEGAQHWLYDALPARVLYRPTVDGAS